MRLSIAIQLVTVGLLFMNWIYAQNGEKLYITALPHTTLLNINGDTFSLTAENQPLTLELRAGRYPMKLWAPGFEVVTDTIMVVQGIRNKYAKALTEKTPEFLEFERLDHEYNILVRRRKRKRNALITANALLAYYVLDAHRYKINRHRREAEAIYQQYSRALTLSDIESHYDNYVIAKGQYDSAVETAKNKLKIGVPVLLASFVGSWLHIKNMNKKPLPERPIFQPKPPFWTSNLELEIDSFGAGFEIGFRIKF